MGDSGEEREEGRVGKEGRVGDSGEERERVGGYTTVLASSTFLCCSY